MINRQWDIFRSTAASSVRAWNGINSNPADVKPAKTLVLYEFEGCPYCRLVREVVTELDLDVEIRPCPKGGERFRSVAIDKGGKEQFPLLHDPNKRRWLYESDEIIAYLYKTYGKRDVPLKWRVKILNQLTSFAASLARGRRGTQARLSKLPSKPLELYSFEASPFARPVRELMCELELPYTLRSVGRMSLADWTPPVLRDALELHSGSEVGNRADLFEQKGRVSIPFLRDPNTGAELFESAEILKYLRDTYEI